MIIIPVLQQEQETTAWNEVIFVTACECFENCTTEKKSTSCSSVAWTDYTVTVKDLKVEFSLKKMFTIRVRY